MVCLGFSGCSQGKADPPHQKAVDLHTKKMLASEGMVLHWIQSGRLKPLTKSVLNMRLPDAASLEMFEDRVRFVGVEPLAPAVAKVEQGDSVTRDLTLRRWKISPSAKDIEPAEVAFWEHIFPEVDFFYSGKFKIYLPPPTWIRDDLSEWRTTLLFSGLARTKEGRKAKLKVLQNVYWRRQQNEGLTSETAPQEADWRIYAWETLSAETIETEELLFADVLDEAVDNADDLESARRSIHEEMVLEYLRDPSGFTMPHKLWRPESGDRHPGVAVVDLNRDGFDDFYVMERWGRNLFFRNEGNGKFKEIGREIGLDFSDHCSSAIFADFDNDGDADCVLGRTMDRSLYLRNDEGRFVNVSDTMVEGGELPFLVSSMTAVDYNSDGLLDLYIATFAGDTVQRAMLILRGRRKSGGYVEVLKPYLEPADWEQLHAMILDTYDNDKFFTSAPGPPNVLLKNLGNGRFAVDRISPELRLFRNTYQATWSDFDADGDPDVYCANDFSPNNLFRNDGNGKFTDITEQTQTADIGFGMGATWGDYNNDNRQDLYVTNMFSKAGRRITSFFTEGGINYDPQAMPQGISPVFRRMAGGNSLFEAQDGPFKKVSGMRPPAMTVEEGGWGWGAQFVDFDNDSYLDIYALCGYYTAPQEAALDVDL